MAQLLKVRPTKIELVNLKRRLALSSRVQKIVKDRLSILTLEFLETARETVEAREKLLSNFSLVYRALSITAGYHGYVALEKELIASERDLGVAAGSRSVAGVRTPAFELISDGVGRGYNIADTSSWLDHAVELSEKCLEAIVALAESQRSLELLGMEINRTKRTSNALEYIVIPGLQATIKYLEQKFEERDREEKTRLKRVKVLLERQG